jgi:hypothetical protein
VEAVTIHVIVKGRLTPLTVYADKVVPDGVNLFFFRNRRLVATVHADDVQLLVRDLDAELDGIRSDKHQGQGRP